MQTDSLSHLVAFACVARHSSFRQASAELGLSPSAVSYAVRGLEKRLGVSLFNRTTRSVSLTVAGRYLLERIRPALRDVSEALDQMDAFQATRSGTLRINTSRAAAYLLVSPLLPHFLAAYPDIHVEIVHEEGPVDIVAAGFDAGIRLEGDVPDDMMAVSINRSQRLVAVAAPTYLRGGMALKHPRDLMKHECIRYRFPNGRVPKWEFARGDTRLEVDVPGRVTLDDMYTVARMALAGSGVAFVLEDYVRPLLDEGRLVRLLEDWCPLLPGFMLYYPGHSRMPPALRAFIDMARASSM